MDCTDSAVLLLLQATSEVLGVNLNLGPLGNKLMAVINALFTVLSILGIVADPTTEGVGDSSRALTYDKPRVNLVNSVRDSILIMILLIDSFCISGCD